jgi:phosphoribosylaminoimidazole-succinocarboxamide synthase
MIETNLIKDIPFDGGNYQIVEFLDIFNLNNQKKTRIKDLGQKVASLHSVFFDYLKEFHIPIAYIKKEETNSLKFVKYENLNFSVKILNCADKRTAKIFSLKEGSSLELPVFELHYGNQKESMISESHLITFNLCSTEELKMINRICSKINAVLRSFFERRNFTLAELSCRFGKFEGKVYMTGNFSPDSLKVFPVNEDLKWKDPYKLLTSAHIKGYTDQLIKIISS